VPVQDLSLFITTVSTKHFRLVERVADSATPLPLIITAAKLENCGSKDDFSCSAV
jgi:hypothetical protein